MLIGLNEILDLADGFAVPAFNTYNMETVMGVIEAAEECGAPVIIQAYSRLFASKEAYYLSPIVLAAAEKASVPVCFQTMGRGSWKSYVLSGTAAPVLCLTALLCHYRKISKRRKKLLPLVRMPVSAVKGNWAILVQLRTAL